MNYSKKDRYIEDNKRVVSYVYDNLDLSKYNFEILDKYNQLSKFVSNKYFLTHNYYGKNSFLVFARVRGKYYSSVIDRRTMSYDKSKLNTSKLDVIHFNVDVDEKIFEGSIFDGTYNKINGEHVFVISDIFYFCGEDMRKVKLDLKMMQLKLYLDNMNHIRSNKFKINKRYNLELRISEFENIKNIKEFIQSNIHARGICFYPEITGTKMIYNFNDKIDNTRSYAKKIVAPNRLNKSNNNNNTNNNYSKNNGGIERSDSDKKRLIKISYSAKSSDDIYAILEMKGTRIPDNYKMSALELRTKNGEKRHRKFPMDIAYIPDLKKSLWCRDITSKNSNASVMVKCIWRNDKNKWEPMELSSEKLPTMINKIREHLIEIEESDSDSDNDI
jgi:hypothetical protein